MNICICDDDKNTHSVIKFHIQSFYNDISQINFMDLYCAEELLKKHNMGISFDIIFLDIEMHKISGIEAAEKIKQLTPKTIIIFVSNFPNYVFDAFNVEALHFLTKPLSKQEFHNVFNRALHKYRTINSSITLKWHNERYVIKIDSIKYIEGYKRHITVYAQDGIYESIGKIPELLQLLSPHGFIRTHQGFIVNMDHIKRFDATDVVLFDGSKVMISVRKRAEALQQFDKYLKSKKW